MDFEKITNIEKYIGAHVNNLENKDLLISKINKNIKDGIFYEETRIHSKDQYVSDNKPLDVCKKIISLGQKTVCVTQLGVAFAIWDFKNLQEEFPDLKVIPGVEILYQENAKKDKNGLMVADKVMPMSHLVLHAMNDDGWKAISMAISNTQTEEGFCLFDNELLAKYFGKDSLGYNNVIVTTGGLNGPLANIYKTNSIAKEGIKKRKAYIEDISGGSITDDRINKLKNLIENVDDYRNELKEERKKYNKLANKKFTSKENKVKKYKENNNPKYEMAKEELEKEIKESNEAKYKLEDVKEKINKQNKRYSALNKELKELEKIIKKSSDDFEAINTYKAEISEIDVLDQRALDKLLFLKGVFGENNIYVEIQSHFDDNEEKIYSKIIETAKKCNLPLIATNDVHMLDDSDDELLKLSMIRSQENFVWVEPTKIDKELYFKTDEEMFDALSYFYDKDDVIESMLNTLVLVNRCNVDFKVKNHHPKFRDEQGRTSEEIFIDLIEKEIPNKFPDGLDNEHKERLNHEIKIMKDMGYVDYHLVVKDFNNYASEYDSIPFNKLNDAPIPLEELKKWKEERGYNKKIGISNGTGRGSAVGSLVCDLLNITHLDPLKYNLLFERFLNPERITMPDIDSDISRTIRPKVIKYIVNKYGEECVASIATEQSQGAKGSIRAAAKCLSLYENKDDLSAKNPQLKHQRLEDDIAKSVPDGFSDFNDIVDENKKTTLYDYLLKEYHGNKVALEIIRWAKLFEGVFTAYGSHAAGIVVTEGEPVSSIVPLRWNKDLKIYAVQCDKEQVEELGMLKFDLLGLKTVDIINDCLWEISKSGNIINVYDIPLDDKEVYENIYSKGFTNSVFQFESAGMKKMLKRFKPERFEDLIILNSMFRPGPLQFLDDVIDVKNGNKEISFLTDKLRPILEPTYGAITYQEQVMQIFQQLAGYTLGGADLVRRYMSKKKMEKLIKEKKAFIYGDSSRDIKGCVNNGIDEESANKLFEQMTDFAKYAFNKSHSAAYSFESYVTAWLKYHYPAEFLMSAMRWSEKLGTKDPLPGLVEEAKNFNIKVNLPDVNNSYENFSLLDGNIQFGLSKIKSVGKEADKIVKERKENGPYKNLKDFFERIYINKQALKNLVFAGAFDSFVKNRSSLLIVLSKLSDLSKSINNSKKKIHSLKEELLDAKDKEKINKKIEKEEFNLEKSRGELNNVIIPPDIKEDFGKKLSKEKELVGAYISSHPLDNYPDPSELENVDSIDSISEDTQTIAGIITDIRNSKRKSDGKPMAFLKVEDKTGVCDVNVFANSYQRCSDFIKVGAVVIINGYARIDTFNKSDDEKEYVFNANIMSFLEEKKPGLLLSVRSILTFHVYNEDKFIKKYKNDKGVDLFIHDKITNQIRKMKYKVDNSLLESGYDVNVCF